MQIPGLAFLPQLGPKTKHFISGVAIKKQKEVICLSESLFQLGRAETRSQELSLMLGMRA